MELTGKCDAGDIAAGSAGSRLPEGTSSWGQPLHCIPWKPFSLPVPAAAVCELHTVQILFPQ